MPPQAVAMQDLARLSWPHLTDEQRRMVDLVAKDHFENELSPEQRQRIGGSTTARFQTLSDWRKLPFRGQALRDLGLDVPDQVLQAI